MLDTDLGQTYTYNKRSLFQKQLRLYVRIILCLMSSGVFVHTFALAFRKMSSAIAKTGPSKVGSLMKIDAGVMRIRLHTDVHVSVRALASVDEPDPCACERAYIYSMCVCICVHIICVNVLQVQVHFHSSATCTYPTL